jgi:hypothetical protein
MSRDTRYAEERPPQYLDRLKPPVRSRPESSS